MSHIPVLKNLETPQMAVELAGRTATDPLALFGAVGKSERVAKMTQEAAKIPGEVARTVGNVTTGISKEALSKGATDAGRTAMRTAAEAQPSSGARFTEGLKNFSRSMPEKHQVNEALNKAGDIDIRPVLEAFEKSKIPTMGPMHSATPGIIKTNNAIENYARAIRGDLPTPAQIAEMDFGGNLAKANAAIADPKSVWAS